MSDPVLGVGTLERPSTRPLPSWNLPAGQRNPKEVEAPHQPRRYLRMVGSPSDQLCPSYFLQASHSSWVRGRVPMKGGLMKAEKGEASPGEPTGTCSFPRAPLASAPGTLASISGGWGARQSGAAGLPFCLRNLSLTVFTR